MLILHQFDIGRHKVEAREVCFADDVREWPPFLIVADRSVKGFVLRYIELGLIAVQRGEARLRVEIDCECPVAAKRKELSEMRGGGRLPAAPFEVHDRDDLKMVTISPRVAGIFDRPCRSRRDTHVGPECLRSNKTVVRCGTHRAVAPSPPK